jgi:hypothetical protein
MHGACRVSHNRLNLMLRLAHLYSGRCFNDICTMSVKFQPCDQTRIVDPGSGPNFFLPGLRLHLCASLCLTVGCNRVIPRGVVPASNIAIDSAKTLHPLYVRRLAICRIGIKMQKVRDGRS